ncbi:serine/threonine-protein kinase [Alkalilimnicola sp. S0819]|uniref:serine/threonine-protein kinase n=1 Tax=Alkalilimnicola sp. S0819 TaxID=2613922 RepID=UPI0012620B99|nr:serine/threonine-protein kinase [Alkalilimnicola sp. S0819]KAB7622621.1 serine/threonine protein kinase [Alkalilimnicola sp. S0819]MPQ17392.1 protein kinase [Alkalilimnicola sp. S0819]
MEALTTGEALACPAASPTELAALAPPLPCDLVLAGRYRLCERLASGATSHVYRAEDLLSRALSGREAPVALKVYTGLRLAGRDLAPRLALAELHTARRLQHPHILRIHDLGWEPPVCFLSMEYIAGETLARRLQRSPAGGLPAGLARGIALALAAAVDAAHEVGIVHGDIKPANVLLGDCGEIKLIDFAGARDRDAGRDERACLSYSARYASPALLAGAAPGPRDDYYALACLIYQLFAGALPYGTRDALQGLRVGMRPQRPPGMGRRGWRVLQGVLAQRADREGATAWVRRVL